MFAGSVQPSGKSMGTVQRLKLDGPTYSWQVVDFAGVEPSDRGLRLIFGFDSSEIYNIHFDWLPKHSRYLLDSSL
jgi:hypothetical protein